MRAAVFDGPGQLNVRDWPTPACAPGGALLRVHACAVCGSDVRIARAGHAHITPPQVLGHEVVGTITESAAPAVEVGSRVVIAPAIGCGECRHCRAGRPNRCPGLRTIGYEFTGAFAPWLAIPPEAVAQGSVTVVPDDLPDEVACLTEPLACCLNGQELVSVGPGDQVVIVGAGPIGCLHARLAASRGASQVILVEQRESRRGQAAALGLGLVLAPSDELGEQVRSLTEGGADVVIVAAPAPAAQAAGLGWLAPGGRLSCFGGLPPGSGAVPLETNRVHYQELLVAGAHGSSPSQNRVALELLASGRVKAADLVTGRYRLDETPEAIAAMAAGEGLKSVVALLGPS